MTTIAHHKGKLHVPAHPSSLVYLEVSPANYVTHMRIQSECFPVPPAWGLADIYQYIRGRHLWRVAVRQHTTDGGVLRSAPTALNEWLMQYAMTAPGHALGTAIHDVPEEE